MITQARLDAIRQLYGKVPRDITEHTLPAVRAFLQNIPELIDAIESAYTPRDRDVLLCVEAGTVPRYVYVAQYCDLGDGISPYWQVVGSDFQYTDDEILPFAVELLHREDQEQQ